METPKVRSTGCWPTWCSPFGGIPRNWKRPIERLIHQLRLTLNVPPSGGSLEIGNLEDIHFIPPLCGINSSPFGGIPRNWKREVFRFSRMTMTTRSPFGGIPRNWKLVVGSGTIYDCYGSPFGGIPRNWKRDVHSVLPLQG